MSTAPQLRRLRRPPLRVVRSTWVDSEVTPLRRVVVHRPGPELDAITPATMHELLFDDLPWLAAAQSEHDAFTDVLRARGAEGLELQTLLSETLAIPEARDEVLDATVTLCDLGPHAAGLLREWLQPMPGAQLATRLVGGIAYDELAELSRTLPGRLGARGRFVVPPLPNHVFTRDSSAWMFDVAAVGAMRHRARARESAHVTALYRHHPLFTTGGARLWDNAEQVGVEGGAVLVVGNGCVASASRSARVRRLSSASPSGCSARLPSARSWRWSCPSA